MGYPEVRDEGPEPWVAASCDPHPGVGCGWVGRVGVLDLFRVASEDAPHDMTLYPAFACPSCGVWSLAWLDAEYAGMEGGIPVRGTGGRPTYPVAVQEPQ